MKFYGVTLLLFTTLFLINVECKLTLPQLKGMVGKFIAPCLKKTGASEELYQNSLTGDFAEDPNFTCFFKCIFKSLNALKNDRIQEEVLTKMVGAMVVPETAPILNGLVHECISEAANDDTCLAAFYFAKCWYHKNPEYYLFG